MFLEKQACWTKFENHIDALNFKINCTIFNRKSVIFWRLTKHATKHVDYHSIHKNLQYTFLIGLYFLMSQAQEELLTIESAQVHAIQTGSKIFYKAFCAKYFSASKKIHLMETFSRRVMELHEKYFCYLTVSFERRFNFTMNFLRPYLIYSNTIADLSKI